MATYVLVHGAYQGGWIWKPVADRLRAAGHLVHAPTLDGCAERHHAVRPGITVGTHAREVAGLLFYEDLRQVVLVGTSSGGMVLVKAAPEARDRIARVVFVDALALLPGEQVSGIVKRTSSPEITALTISPTRADLEQRLFADLDPGLRAWAAARCTPHPIAALEAFSTHSHDQNDYFRVEGERFIQPGAGFYGWVANWGLLDHVVPAGKALFAKTGLTPADFAKFAVPQKTGIRPLMTMGKLELDMMGSQQMSERQVLEAVLAEAIKTVFQEYVDQHGLDEIAEVFGKGVKIEVGDMLPSSHYAERLRRVPKAWEKAFEVNASENEAVRASCIEASPSTTWGRAGLLAK